MSSNGKSASTGRVRSAHAHGETAPVDREIVPAAATQMGAKSAPSARKAGAIERLCVAHGLRMTGQRRVIAQIINDADDHPDVVELHRRAAQVDENIALSTVYRTVKLFEDQGIIERHQFGDGRARYETAPKEHHDHLINIRTGAVIEFHSPEIEQLQAEIARKLGFKLVHHRLELYALPLDDEAE